MSKRHLTCLIDSYSLALSLAVSLLSTMVLFSSRKTGFPRFSVLIYGSGDQIVDPVIYSQWEEPRSYKRETPSLHSGATSCIVYACISMSAWINAFLLVQTCSLSVFDPTPACCSYFFKFYRQFWLEISRLSLTTKHIITFKPKLLAIYFLSLQSFPCHFNKPFLCCSNT